MSDFDNHHYIPRFFLSAWHSGEDDCLTRMTWIPSGLECRRKRAKYVGRMEGLYSLKGHPERNIVEFGFLRDLDGLAAPLHRRLITDDPRELTDVERSIWSQFVVSLLVRTPERIEEIRRYGASAFSEELKKKPEEYDNAKPPGAPGTLGEYVELLWPNAKNDFGVQTLPKLIQSSQMNSPFAKAEWMTAKMDVPRALLLGDRPVIYNSKPNGGYLFSLPLSPQHMFFAFDSPVTGQRLEAMSQASLVRKLNRAAATLAKRFVVGTDDADAWLVQKHFPRSEARRPHQWTQHGLPNWARDLA